FHFAAAAAFGLHARGAADRHDGTERHRRAVRRQQTARHPRRPRKMVIGKYEPAGRTKGIVIMSEKTQTQETSPGTFLKQCRQEQGHSLEAVHEATKIPLDVLRGIEEGYKVRTLSPFYYKGFLKLYANYLNVELNHA